MNTWPRHPVTFEVNTWVWLNDLSGKHRRVVDLHGPGAGVGCHRRRGVRRCLVHGRLGTKRRGDWHRHAKRRSPPGFRRALSDFSPQDNVGSPYCVRRYIVDEHLGGPKGLAAARRHLGQRGLRLILDFVPNHVAPDNPWVGNHPEYFWRRGNAISFTCVHCKARQKGFE